jgi:hypothetical protein
MTAPLMPKATAVWLVENTTLTFRQIAKFCEIHELEIQAIADGDVAYNIVGLSPINNNQLTWEEIHRCEADSHADLQANVFETNVKERNAKAKRMLSPTQRSEKPAAILWILKNFPDIMDSQICKLIGTTKPTIAKIRNGEHTDMANIKPKNPITIGLCEEKDLEYALEVSKARLAPKPKKKTKKRKAKKATVKKTAAKKTATKTAAKKTTTKKAAAKKTTAKKASAKTAAKKTATKKATAKKTAAKKSTAKVATKKTATKKASVKTAAKKAPAKKTAAKKATVKKTATKKTATKKTTTKKSATKTVAAKKAAPKKTVAKKASVKKAPVKKTAAKKTTAKKTATKKTAAKKSTAKKAAK